MCGIVKICSNCNFSNDEYQAVCSNCGYILDTNNNMYPVQKPITNGLAIASMVLGIVSFLGCGCLTGILAIILAKIAKGQIRMSNGQQEGEGFATAGLILGIVATIMTILFIILYIAIFGVAFLTTYSTYSSPTSY